MLNYDCVLKITEWMKEIEKYDYPVKIVFDCDKITHETNRGNEKTIEHDPKTVTIIELNDVSIATCTESIESIIGVVKTDSSLYEITIRGIDLLEKNGFKIEYPTIDS